MKHRKLSNSFAEQTNHKQLKHFQNNDIQQKYKISIQAVKNNFQKIKKIQLFYFITYYSQTDSTIKKINQEIEIVFKIIMIIDNESRIKADKYIELRQQMMKRKC